MVEAEPVVRRPRPGDPRSRSGRGPTRRSSGKPSPAPKQSATRNQTTAGKRSPTRKRTPTLKQTKGRSARASRKVEVESSSDAQARAPGVAGYLVRPSTDGPRVRLGILWFILAVGSVVAGRWALLALWGLVAATAAWQLARVWLDATGRVGAPSFSAQLAAVAAAVLVSAASIGTSLAGLALIVVPLAIVGATMLSGRKPAAAGAAVIAAVLSSVPAMSVVLVARAETWAALFLVFAVSFYDAGYFIGAAESSSRLEGPVTGGIGLLAVTFTASAFEAQPFDRATAWIAGAMILFACPLGQMLTSAELPRRDADVPAMRRLDAYVVSAPLMLGAVWALS